MNKQISICIEIVSVSLRSIIHSYDLSLKEYEEDELYKFPSPYGVSFILIKVGILWYILV